MNVWLNQLALAALGMSLLALLAWAGLRALGREAATTYRFLLLSLMLGMLMPGLQLSAAIAAAGLVEASASGLAPVAGSQVALPRRTVEMDVRIVNVNGKVSATAMQKSALIEPHARLEGPPGLSPPWPGPEYASVLLMIYFMGALTMVAYQSARLFWTVCFLARCRPLTDRQVRRLWEEVSANSSLRNRVRLLVSQEVQLPCCWGLFVRYLVLPADSGTSPEDALRWSLRHELVHLERGDARMVLLQMLLLTMYWYHPAAWWLSRRLNWWREASCDFAVVERTGQRRSYALALVHFARASVEAMPNLGPSLLHAASPRSHLRDRVHMLAKFDQCYSRWRRGLTWMAALGVLAVIGAAQLGAAFAILHPETASASVRMPRHEEERIREKVEFKAIHAGGRRGIRHEKRLERGTGS